MNRWKSDAVVAWLELVVKMPMYAKQCSDNVKSGKVSTEARVVRMSVTLHVL